LKFQVYADPLRTQLQDYTIMNYNILLVIKFDLTKLNLDARMNAFRLSILMEPGFTPGLHLALLFTESSGVRSQRGQKHDGVVMLMTSTILIHL